MLNPILIISSSKRYRPLFSALKDLAIDMDQVISGNEALMRLAAKSYSAVVMEWDLASSRGFQTVKEMRRIRPRLPVLALGSGSDGGDEGEGQSSMRIEYLPMTGVENVDLARLVACLKEILPELRARVLPGSGLLWMKTRNQRMRELLSLVDVIKDESGSVLILGENGTGKEVIAWQLHYSGRGHMTPFVAINCAAIPETLLESELFGHEKGSFTGATERRIGKFELAHRGTAFLDEIGDMPLSTQAKILRVLETGEIERVGGHNKIPVKVRIVAATNQNIPEKIEKGQFRQDLYYRINTFTLNLPPLRERQEDLLPLAQHFLDLIAARGGGGPRKRLSREAEDLLLAYGWPGNVRELRNVMERAAVLTSGNLIGPGALPEEIVSREGRADSASLLHASPSTMASLRNGSSIVALKELEREAIIEALTRLGYNATQAAKRLGISKATLYRKLKQYGISRRFGVWD